MKEINSRLKHFTSIWECVHRNWTKLFHVSYFARLLWAQFFGVVGFIISFSCALLKHIAFFSFSFFDFYLFFPLPHQHSTITTCRHDRVLHHFVSTIFSFSSVAFVLVSFDSTLIFLEHHICMKIENIRREHILNGINRFFKWIALHLHENGRDGKREKNLSKWAQNFIFYLCVFESGKCINQQPSWPSEVLKKKMRKNMRKIFLSFSHRWNAFISCPTGTWKLISVTILSVPTFESALQKWMIFFFLPFFFRYSYFQWQKIQSTKYYKITDGVSNRV